MNSADMVRAARLAARESDDELFSLSRASFDSYARGRAAIATGEINDAALTFNADPNGVNVHSGLRVAMRHADLITWDDMMHRIPFD